MVRDTSNPVSGPAPVRTGRFPYKAKRTPPMTDPTLPREDRARLRETICDAAVESGILLANSGKRKAAMPTADVERIDVFCDALLSALAAVRVDPEPVGWTARSILNSVKSGEITEGWLWATHDERHPLPLYAPTKEPGHE